MIPHTTKGSSFAGALRYDIEKQNGQVIDTNCVNDTWEDLAIEMDIFANASRSKIPVLHTSLSLAEGETMTDEEWKKAADIYLREMGLSGHQFVMTKHNDTEHEHVHLVINRVNEHGRLASDSNDWPREQAACRVVEKKMGLQVIDKNYQNQNDGRFNDVKKNLREAAAVSKSAEDLRAQLKEHGYNLILHQSKTTGRISGASIQAMSDNKTWKLSDLQKGGWHRVEKSLAKNAEKENAHSIKSNYGGNGSTSRGVDSSTKRVSASNGKISDSAISAAVDGKERAYLIYLRQEQDIAEIKKLQEENFRKSKEREQER